MAEPAWWKARLRERVVEAEGHCGDVVTLLADVHLLLDAPMHTGAAAGAARTSIQVAQNSLSIATHHLNVAASLMRAAELLALHGGSPNTAQPLPSIQHLGAQDVAVRNALAKLQIARVRADDAYADVELCRGYLSTACILLDHPGLPGVDSLIDGERFFATYALQAARQLAAPARMWPASTERSLSSRMAPFA